MKTPDLQLPKGLMAKLARALKVDFLSLQESGKLSPDAVRRMQNHCSACSDPGLCGRLIKAKGGQMTEPPKFCPNRNIFLALKKEGQKR